ncbi:alpha/beta fold hydrolase [Roseomonas sp. AR75]|uniref:alpha/beta fold hydrolase n=1 Tax=Roseomonas sp. AR75 TaxID=2562311 RepID=UPI0010C11CB3|nr:alpha/beta hydrolase [Roseomonas sp. AR75]
MLRRGFVDVPGGQVHVRETGRGLGRPLVLIHASPGSSLMLAPLIEAFGQTRQVIAPDTAGNGDSAVALPEAPDIDVFAATHLAALDALHVERFDLYGTHTGASIAAEICLRAPGRVRRLILDGVGLYTAEEQAEMLARYAPAMQPDLQAQYLMWAWHFVRDTYVFWPWYATDAAHRRPLGLPGAEALHEKLVEVLKALTTYHKSYRAAFAYDKRARFPLLRVKTLAACARTDMLARMFEEFAALVPSAERTLTPGIATPEALAETVALFSRFLDAPEVPEAVP